MKEGIDVRLAVKTVIRITPITRTAKLKVHITASTDTKSDSANHRNVQNNFNYGDGLNY